MSNPAWWNVLAGKAVEALPAEPVTLTPTQQSVTPCAAHLGAESFQPHQVRGNSVILEVSGDDPLQPCADCWHRFMPLPVQCFANRRHCCSHALLRREANELEPPFTVCSTTVCKPQKVEKFDGYVFFRYDREATTATLMAAALPFSRNNRRKSDSLIWLGDLDPAGQPWNPVIKDLVYEKQGSLARYRAHEMRDQAEVASLIEVAAFRTSTAASATPLARPYRYLYRTYVFLVEKRLRETVIAAGMENYVLEKMASSEPHQDAEEEVVRRLTRQKVFELMDDQGRALWDRHLLGFDVRELAAQEGQTVEYVGKRLRRATERALRQLFAGGR